MMMYSRVPPFEGSTSRWKGVSFTTTGLLNAIKALPYSLVNLPTTGLVHFPLSLTFNLEAKKYTTLLESPEVTTKSSRVQ